MLGGAGDQAVSDFAREMYLRAILRGMVLTILVFGTGVGAGAWICQATHAVRAADGLARRAESYLALRPIADSVIRLRASVPLASCP